MSNPVQVNMYGIRYFIDGDLSDPLVKKLMVQARNDLQQMKGRNINNIGHTWLNKPNAYKIVSQFGIDSAYINVPVLVGEEHKKEKEVYKIEEEWVYRFVPAIVIAEPGTGVWENLMIDGAYPYAYRLDVGDISVCNSPYWGGSIVVVKEADLTLGGNDGDYRNPGLKYKDGPITKEMEIIGCTNWGNRRGSTGVNILNTTWVDTDTGFNPAPEDAGPMTDLLAIDTVWTWVTGAPGADCPDVVDVFDEYFTPDTHWNDGYVIEVKDYGLFSCDLEWWKDTYLLILGRCDTGHLFFEYEVRGFQERIRDPDVWGSFGVCFSGDLECVDVVYTQPVPLTVAGGPQNRMVVEGQIKDYEGFESYVDSYRSEGNIYFDTEVWPYSWEKTETWNPKMPALCTTNQFDSNHLYNYWPDTWGIPGAFIQDIVGSGTTDASICPIEGFHGKYIIAVVESLAENYNTFTCPNEWYVTGYGYGSFGWLNGTVHDCHMLLDNPYTSKIIAYEDCYILCMNVNGERYEIDRTETRAIEDYSWEEIEVIDSAILDFMGTPVYMYAYVKYEYKQSIDEPNKALYTRYGYFLNGGHYQSRKFYPAGIVDPDAGAWFGGDGGDVYTCLHDVSGSSSKNKYGFGQLAGYIVKEKIITKGAPIRER